MSLLTDFDTFSVRLRKALKEAAQSNAPDAFSSVEIQGNDLRKFNEDLKSSKQDRTERKGYALKLYWLISVWLGSLLLFVFMQATHEVPFTDLPFQLSNVLLVTLITTTTANVAAFFLLVVRYLFKNK